MSMDMNGITPEMWAKIYAAADGLDGSIDGKIVVKDDDDSIFEQALKSVLGEDIEYDLDVVLKELMDFGIVTTDIEEANGTTNTLSANEESASSSDIAKAYAQSAQNYANTQAYQETTRTSTRGDSNNIIHGANIDISSLNVEKYEGTYTSANNLDNLDLETLRDQRGTLLENINSKRSEMDEAKAQARGNVDTAKAAYDQALEEAAQNNEDLREEQFLKREKENQISDQNGIIDQIKGQIQNQTTQIANLKSQLASISYPSPDDENYDAIMAACARQEATLKAQINFAEDELSQMEQSLAEAEDALNILEQEAVAIDDEIIFISGMLDDDTLYQAGLAYQEAQAVQNTIASGYEAEISAMQADLENYDTAISAAQIRASEVDMFGGVLDANSTFINNELDAMSNPSSGISENAQVMSVENQTDILSAILKEGIAGYTPVNGKNGAYFEKRDENGNVDYFKVVQDGDSIKIVHTSASNGTASSEIYGFEGSFTNITRNQGNIVQMTGTVTDSSGRPTDVTFTRTDDGVAIKRKTTLPNNNIQIAEYNENGVMLNQTTTAPNGEIIQKDEYRNGRLVHQEKYDAQGNFVAYDYEDENMHNPTRTIITGSETTTDEKGTTTTTYNNGKITGQVTVYSNGTTTTRQYYSTGELLSEKTVQVTHENGITTTTTTTIVYDGQGNGTPRVETVSIVDATGEETTPQYYN